MPVQKTRADAGNVGPSIERGKRQRSTKHSQPSSTASAPRANALCVYDGASFVGTLIERNGEYRAFDVCGLAVSAHSRLASRRCAAFPATGVRHERARRLIGITLDLLAADKGDKK
jgi:hypothetical protein